MLFIKNNFSNFSSFLNEFKEQGGEFNIENILTFEKFIDFGNVNVLFLNIFS